MAALVRFPPLPSREMIVSCWLPGIPALNAALVHLSRGVPAPPSSLLKLAISSQLSQEVSQETIWKITTWLMSRPRVSCTPRFPT